MSSAEITIQQLSNQITQLKSELRDKDVKLAVAAIPPPKTIDDVQPRPVETATSSDDVQIEFSDGTHMFIRSTWKDKSALLKRGGINYREPDKFCKYILPILRGDNFRWSDDADTTQEVGRLCDEVKAYGIELTDLMVASISDCYNLHGVIMKIKVALEDINNFLSINKRKRYKVFKADWDNYVKLLAVHYSHPNYEGLTADILTNAIQTTTYVDVGKLNIKYDNIIFDFAQHLTNCVIQKHSDEFLKVRLQLSLNLSENTSTLLTNGAALVQSLIAGLGSKVPESLKQTIISKVDTIQQVSKLLGPSPS